MRVLICGNTGWPEAKPIFDVLFNYQVVCEDTSEPLTSISGMAPGADTIALYLSWALDIPCDEYPASLVGWKKAMEVQGKENVGGSRNQWMLDSGVDVCHAFAYDIRTSIGTRDMVNRCVAAGVPVFWSNGTITRSIIETVDKNTSLDTMEVVNV